MASSLPPSLMRAGRADSPLRLAPDSMELALAHWQRRHYNKQDTVFEPGEPGVTVYCVLEGTFEVWTRDEEGKVFVLERFEPGDFVGEIGLFAEPVPRSVTMRAVTAGVLAEIDSQRLNQLLAPKGNLAHLAGPFLYAVGAQLSRRLRTTTRKAGNLALLDVRGRIMQVLWELGQSQMATSTAEGRQFRLSRVNLAQHASCSREMAGRVVTGLEHEGLLRVQGKQITVLVDAWPTTLRGESGQRAQAARK